MTGRPRTGDGGAGGGGGAAARRREDSARAQPGHARHPRHECRPDHLNHRGILLALISFALLGAAACREQPAPPAPEAVAWRAIGTWSGRGNRQTGSFSVETGALRVRWETRNERPPSTGTFRVSLHSAISGRPLQVAVDHQGPGADTSYLEDNARVSYLVIESQNLDWTLSLDEAVRATPY